MEVEILVVVILFWDLHQWQRNKQGLPQDSEAAKGLGPLEACLKISRSILELYLKPTCILFESYLKHG